MGASASGRLDGKVAIVPGAGQGIGRVVAFLCSDGGGCMTGNTVFLDGGSHIDGVSWQPAAR